MKSTGVTVDENFCPQQLGQRARQASVAAFPVQYTVSVDTATDESQRWIRERFDLIDSSVQCMSDYPRRQIMIQNSGAKDPSKRAYYVSL